MSKNTGGLVISLDFELLWGVFDKVNLQDKLEYFSNTREIIPEILKQFELNDIKATWATVGMLFNSDWDEWNSNIPVEIPTYHNRKLCAYTFGSSIQNKNTEKFCFAPELIRAIISTKDQEMATHTYSHYYCLENGQTVSQFKEDIQQADKLSSKFDVKLKSLVFPRNQFNPRYLNVCNEFGLQNIRTNPENWYWRDTERNSLIQKIFRTGDAYLGGYDKSYKNDRIVNHKDGYNLQKASRFLRPVGSNKHLNQLRMKRILSEMKNAAIAGKLYHLWWHPHNFGENSKKNMEDLETILAHFKFLRNKYGFNSFSMDDHLTKRS